MDRNTISAIQKPISELLAQVEEEDPNEIKEMLADAWQALEDAWWKLPALEIKTPDKLEAEELIELLSGEGDE